MYDCYSAASWFTVDLVNPIIGDIEVCICSSTGASREDTPILLLELCVQYN